MGDGSIPESRRSRTAALLSQIQALPDGKQRNEKAWEVVALNKSLAHWLAQNCGGSNFGEDDVAEAQIAMHSAALYCDPEKRSSYATVARWYYMRRISDSRNVAGVHVPANLTQIALRVSRWCAAEETRTGTRPSVEKALEVLQIRAKPERIRGILALRNKPAQPGLNIETVFDEGTEHFYVQLSAAYEEDSAEDECDLSRLREFLATLSPLERDAVLTCGGDTGAIAQVGEVYDVPRKHVAAVRRRVLSRLRCRLRASAAVPVDGEEEGEKKFDDE